MLCHSVTHRISLSLYELLITTSYTDIEELIVDYVVHGQTGQESDGDDAQEVAQGRYQNKLSS